MSPTVLSLVAGVGVNLYVVLHYGALYLMRRRHEHRAFAALCACLAAYSGGAALVTVSSSVADALAFQKLETVGILLAAGFFVDLCVELGGSPRRRFVAGTYTLVGVAVTATLANLYFDPALPDPRYDWALPTPAVPPRAVPSVVSLTFGALIFGCCAYALVSLFRASSERSELRTAGLVTGLGVAGGATDLVAAAFQLPIPALAAQTAILPVIGISYVLAGRFTRIETELAERTDQLALNYERLRVAQAELVRREQLATVGELSAVIAHEVRNPLAIIKNAVGGLRRREVAEANSQTLLGILDEEADRLNRLVTDLLAYSRPISPEVGLVDLRVVVARAVELASGGSANAQSVDVDLDLDFAVDPVEGDEALLRHALINIVDNALQAMPQGGTLTITCRNLVVDGTAFVAVDFDDTGEGMDTLVRSKARDPFFTTRETGTGLGLAIVDRVARAHGGFVEIQSRHGLGSKVSFLVPRERPSGAPRESGAPEPPGP